MATPEMIHREVRVRGGRVHYVDTAVPARTGADEARPALALVHGLGGRRQHYGPAIERLADRTRVIAIDLPGFGESTLPEGRLEFDDHVAAVTAVLDDADAAQVVLVGHSMSGPLVLRFADCHTGRAAALVMVCGTVQSFQRTLARRLEPWRRQPRTALATLAEVAMAATPLPRPVAGRLASTRAGRRLALWPCVHRPADLPAGHAETLIAGAGARGVLPTARALGRIGAWEQVTTAGLPPVYSIAGAFDRIAPLADLKRLPVPLERSLVLDAGHMVMLERTDAFCEELELILAETSG